MTRPAIDCLRRAGLSLRANWGLVLLTVLQNLVVGLLFVASLVPPFLVLGAAALLRGGWDAAALEEWASNVAAGLAGQYGALALAILASILLGLLAVLVWGWFQGGIFGTLVAAERQALPDAQKRAGGAQWFRTFGWREFSGWGTRYVWRFFWFFHLSLTIGLLLMLVALLIVFAVVFGFERWGAGAAYGIGCGAALPFFFALVVFGVWNLTAQPAVALPESGVLRGAAAGLRVIGRRPGATLLIVGVLLVMSLTIGLAVFVTEASLGVLVSDQMAAWVVLYVLLNLLQWLLSTAIGVYGRAAFTSLVVAQAPEVLR